MRQYARFLQISQHYLALHLGKLNNFVTLYCEGNEMEL
ncbi:unnamed protein product [Mycetohabitans rhizoxinica HKI 454]|uniref:Uncharacterized protein n=1 Tax=Mycetohabitans rhizoxinica (strain DSM 19002 / CIP 109453 / HKI 454) TaxID=882378 RepID=E5ASZ1_MYCRK|nr:unnamed protein product [Mycetohabitans rhizoxinica HKI 454]